MWYNKRKFSIHGDMNDGPWDCSVFHRGSGAFDVNFDGKLDKAYLPGATVIETW